MNNCGVLKSMDGLRELRSKLSSNNKGIIQKVLLTEGLVIFLNTRKRLESSHEVGYLGKFMYNGPPHTQCHACFQAADVSIFETWNPPGRLIKSMITVHRNVKFLPDERNRKLKLSADELSQNHIIFSTVIEVQNHYYKI